MPAQKTPPATSPFNWRSTDSSILDPQTKMNDRLSAQLGQQIAGRITSERGDLVRSGAPSQPRVKAK